MAMEFAFELWQMELEKHYHLHKMAQIEYTEYISMVKRVLTNIKEVYKHYRVYGV